MGASRAGREGSGAWLQRCPEGALRSLELQILGSESGSMGEVRMQRCCAACLVGSEGIALGSCRVKLADVIGKEEAGCVGYPEVLSSPFNHCKGWTSLKLF